jgi:MFS family permease
MSKKNGNGRSFEWWMMSNLAIGAGFSAFVALLIPPYITEATGSAANAGIVMAVLSLAAVLGPVLGGFADKYRAHRLIMSFGVLGMAIAFFAFGTAALTTAFFAIDAILMGVSIAAVSAVAPVFIVGTKLPQALQAKQLTSFNLVAPIGQVIGGVMLGAAAGAGWSYTMRFYLAASVMLIAFLITWFSSKKPAERIIAEDVAEKGEEIKKTRKAGIGGVLLFAHPHPQVHRQ